VNDASALSGSNAVPPTPGTTASTSWTLNGLSGGLGHQSYTIDGRTVTATIGSLTASQVAAAFAQGAGSYSGGSISGGT